MSEVKITDLAAATSIDGSELFVASQNGNPVKITTDQIGYKYTSVINMDSLFPLSSGYYTLETAIAAVPSAMRKVGCEICFNDGNNELEKWYFISNIYSYDFWIDKSYWVRNVSMNDIIDLKTYYQTNSSIESGVLLMESLIKNIFLTGVSIVPNTKFKVSYFGINTPQFYGKIGLQIDISNTGGSTWENLNTNYYTNNSDTLSPGGIYKMIGEGSLNNNGINMYIELSDDFVMPSTIAIYSLNLTRLTNKSFNYTINPKIPDYLKTINNITEIIVSSDESDITANFTGNNAIQHALNSITDASEIKKYRIFVKKGVYKITNSSSFIGSTGYPSMINPKDYVDIVGQSKDDCIVWAELPYDDSDIDTSIDRNLHQTIYNWSNKSNLENLTFVAKNIRYVLHQDDDRESNKYRTYNNVDFIFIGDKGSIKCFGIGTHPGSITKVVGGKSRCSVEQSFAAHNSANANKISEFLFEDHEFRSENQIESIVLQNSGSLVNDIFSIKGCSFSNSYQLNYIDWWIYNPNLNDSFNHSEWRIIGSNNKPFYFTNNVNGYSLKVTSNSTGSTSTVRFDVSSAAYSILIKNPHDFYGNIGSPERQIINNYIVFDGSVGLNGYAIGCVSIREEDYSFGTTTSSDSMGKRLGDCSSTNKILTIIIDGISYSITFNKNYTSYTNSQILEEINNVISSVAVASITNIGKDYYPETDINQLVTNGYSDAPILKGSVLSTKNGRVYLCSSSDEIYGIALDDIPAYSCINGEVHGTGRCLCRGYIGLDKSESHYVLSSSYSSGNKYIVSNGLLSPSSDGLIKEIQNNVVGINI